MWLPLVFIQIFRKETVCISQNEGLYNIFSSTTYIKESDTNSQDNCIGK